MRRAALLLFIAGVLVSGAAGAHHASQLRHLDPPEPLDARESTEERDAILASAEARGWTVDRRMQVQVAARNRGSLGLSSVPIRRALPGECIAAIASASGMVAVREVHFEDVPLVPIPLDPHLCGWREPWHSPPDPHRTVAITTCDAQAEPDARELHLVLDALWASDDAAPEGTVELVLLRARRDALGDDALELPFGLLIVPQDRARGERTVSLPGGVMQGALVMLGWSLLGGTLLFGGGALAARKRRWREADEAAQTRTVRRITLSVPRALRPELTAILEDPTTGEHARLRRLRDALIAHATAISAVALVRWRGPGALARARMDELERGVRALELGDAGYRDARGERVALTVLVLHATELLGYDVPLDRDGLASMLFASVPLEPGELERLCAVWTPADPAGGIDDEALRALFPELLAIDGSALGECAACGVVRRASEPRCASCGRAA